MIPRIFSKWFYDDSAVLVAVVVVIVISIAVVVVVSNPCRRRRYIHRRRRRRRRPHRLLSVFEEVEEVVEGNSSGGIGAAFCRQSGDDVAVDRQVDLPAHALQFLGEKARDNKKERDEETASGYSRTCVAIPGRRV